MQKAATANSSHRAHHGLGTKSQDSLRAADWPCPVARVGWAPAGDPVIDNGPSAWGVVGEVSSVSRCDIESDDR